MGFCWQEPIKDEHVIQRLPPENENAASRRVSLSTFYKSEDTIARSHGYLISKSSPRIKEIHSSSIVYVAVVMSNYFLIMGASNDCHSSLLLLKQNIRQYVKWSNKAVLGQSFKTKLDCYKGLIAICYYYLFWSWYRVNIAKQIYTLYTCLAQIMSDRILLEMDDHEAQCQK